MSMLEYLNHERLQDKLRMTPKNAGLTHTGPSNNDICTMPSPDAKFSKLTLSSRKISSNLQLLSSQSLGKIVKKLINFFGGKCGGKAEGQNLHTERAKINKFSAEKQKLNRDSDNLFELGKLGRCGK